MNIFRAIGLISATVSHIFVRYVGQKDEPGSAGQPVTYLSAFCATYLLLLLLRMTWNAFLWPNLFSPLRHLPTVESNSWWSRQSLRIYSEPLGVPHCDWANESTSHHPSGLLRYRTLLNSERILVLSPEALSEVLTTKSYDFRKPSFVVNEFKQVLGIGVLLSEGDEHRAQRKGLQPAFSYRHIKSLYGMMWAVSSDAVATMTEELKAATSQQMLDNGSSGHGQDHRNRTQNCGQEGRTVSSATQTPAPVINIADWATRTTLDIIGIAGMGQNFGAIHDPSSVLYQTYKQISQPSRGAIFLTILRLIFPDWLVNLLPFGQNTRVREAARDIREVCQELIREKRTELQFREQQQYREDEDPKMEHIAVDKDILDVALSDGGFSDTTLVDQLMTFLAAGHETTATALTWAIYILCVHPDMQARLRHEVRTRLPTPSSSPVSNFSTLIDTQTPYLTAVCLEVLRYFPPVPLTLREAIQPTTIRGTPIPAGTKLALCPRAVNRSKVLWGDDSQVFNPERWLGGPMAGADDRNDERSHANNRSSSSSSKGHKRSNYATLTFLHGPRSCIGQAFARAELAILLAVFVGRFEFALEDERLLDERKVKVARGATARPAEGLRVKTRVLEGW